MWRKSTYTICLIVGILSLLSLIFLPIYKFNGNKTFEAYSEYTQYIDNLDEESTLVITNNLDEIISIHLANETMLEIAPDEKAKSFKDNYKKCMIGYYAVMTKDLKRFNDAFLHEIYNASKANIIKDLMSCDDETAKEAANALLEIEDVSSSATKEDLKSYEEKIAPYLLVYKAITKKDVSFDELVNAESSNLLDEKYNKVINYFGSVDKAKNDYLNTAVADVMQTLFLEYDGCADVDSFDAVTKRYAEKGINSLDIVTTWTNMFNRYSVVWNSLEGAGFFDKIGACINDTYRPWALLLITITILVFIINSIKMIIGGVKGIKGKERPRMFFMCCFTAGLAVLLLFFMMVIGIDSVYNFYPIQFSRLLQMFMYGGINAGILIPGIGAIIGAIVQILTIFCRFGKKKED